MKILLFITFIHILLLLIPTISIKEDAQIFTFGGQERLQVKIISDKGKNKSTNRKNKSIGSHQKKSNWNLHHPAPGYPHLAIEKGWEGKVILRISSDKKGNVKQKEILKSSGFRVLDLAALNAVTKWKTMANLNQQAVPIIFKLKRRL